MAVFVDEVGQCSRTNLRAQTAENLSHVVAGNSGADEALSAAPMQFVDQL